MHAKDIVTELVGEGVEDETSFAWLAQLRYYWENNAVMVRQTNACLAYGCALPAPEGAHSRPAWLLGTSTSATPGGWSSRLSLTAATAP